MRSESLPCSSSWCGVKLHTAQATVRVDSLRVPPVQATCELQVRGLRRTRRHVSVRRPPHADTLRAGYTRRPQSGRRLTENPDTRAALLRSRAAHPKDAGFEPCATPRNARQPYATPPPPRLFLCMAVFIPFILSFASSSLFKSIQTNPSPPGGLIF